MRRHAEYQNWVAVVESLSLAQRQELDEHLQTCQGCASDLAAYRQMDACLYPQMWRLRRLL